MSRIKVADEFFLKLSLNVRLPSTVSKNAIKSIAHRARKRDMMGQSYPIYACIRGNHTRCSSVHVTFRGSWKKSLLQ